MEQRNRTGAIGPCTQVRAPSYADSEHATYRWRMAALHVRGAVRPVYRAFYDFLAATDWVGVERGQGLTWLELLI
eukprot:3553727-Alexandrium_andersonii.AAC.1